MYLFHKWINKLFLVVNKFPEHCLKLERCQGGEKSATYKQSKTV